MDKRFVFVNMSTINCIILLLGIALIAWFDIRYKQIPNRILFLLALYKIVFFSTTNSFSLEKLIEIIIITIISILIYVIFKGKIGAGDIKLTIVISLYLSMIEFAYSLIISLILMLFYAVIMILLKKVTLKTNVPLSPFMMMGVFVALIYL